MFHIVVLTWLEYLLFHLCVNFFEKFIQLFVAHVPTLKISKKYYFREKLKEF